MIVLIAYLAISPNNLLLLTLRYCLSQLSCICASSRSPPGQKRRLIAQGGLQQYVVFDFESSLSRERRGHSVDDSIYKCAGTGMTMSLFEREPSKICITDVGEGFQPR